MFAFSEIGVKANHSFTHIQILIMVRKIDHCSLKISKMIYEIFQKSYAIEAALLKCDDFPPLKRSVQSIQDSQTSFFGFYSQDELAAVMELELYKDHVHVRSLTVDPKYFRQGIGYRLLQFVIDEFTSELVTVETGHDNHPAVNFYLNFGFKKDKVFMTDIGIEKISFTLRPNSSVITGPFDF